MMKLLSDKKLYDSLSKKGLQQAGKFTWEKTAQKTLDLFEEVISDRKTETE